MASDDGVWRQGADVLAATRTRRPEHLGEVTLEVERRVDRGALLHGRDVEAEPLQERASRWSRRSSST